MSDPTFTIDTPDREEATAKMSERTRRSDVGTRIRLFASSFAPLFALLALRFDDRRLEVALGATAAICIGDSIRIAVLIPRRVGASPFTIASVADEGNQVAGYLATYLLPFLAAPSPSGRDLAAYVLFLVVAGVIAVRSDMTHINPTLYLLGYRLTSVTTVEGYSGYAVVRGSLVPGSVLRATHLGDPSSLRLSMPDPVEWAFDATALDLDGDMTLVLGRRSGRNLVGAKIEFADNATDELREMVKRTATFIQASTRRSYEPSLRIESGEYLAVPDVLMEKAAPEPPPRTLKQPESSDAKAEPPPAVHIETDPQVRRVLRNASGLDLLPAQSLGKQRFQFYAVVVGSDPEARTSFVRKMNPTKSLETGKLWFSFGERLAKVTEPLLSLDDHFDLVVTTDGIAVLNQGMFEALFRDSETLVARYPIWAKAFATVGLDERQTERLVARCQTDSRLATRLRQIHESGHLAAGKVTLEQVLAQADAVAGGRERFLDEGKLDFDCDDVSMLLKLLNDDLFIGGLSKLAYEAGSKARQP